MSTAPEGDRPPDSKEERYFSGAPVERLDPRKPLPGEISKKSRRQFRNAIFGVGLLGIGIVAGIGMGSGGSGEQELRIAELEAELSTARASVAELRRTYEYDKVEAPTAKGALRPVDKVRHQKIGKQYATGLRKSGAHAAADLMEWFIERWNSLLNFPREDDRVGRRAAALSLLITSMQKNLDPDDYGLWQSELLAGNWLGELHMDTDGDGLPGKRNRPSRGEGFAGESICNVAMALNQTVTDAHILLMPGIRCDAQENRMSVYLGGGTYDSALSEFVKNAREQGFIAQERREKNVRLFIVGNKQTAAPE